jgi:serine/threonine-protein kinase
MLDGTGRVRLMDFSLAAVGAVTDIRVGTPAYMAPEQLAGQEVTSKSDIYALGLVLYELFTGRRVFDATTIAGLVDQHQSGSITPPTEIVRTLDPAIERTILRCLDPDPARRPGSALAVSATLPGGDPLAAALAAGATPSPEMVAAAGGVEAAMSAARGFVWLASTLLLMGVVVILLDRSSMLSRIPIKPPAALQDKAEELRGLFGYTEPVADQATGMFFDTTYLRWADGHGAGTDGWPSLSNDRPAVARFWYRTSPRVLAPFNRFATVSLADPPLAVSTMAVVQLDTSGRLLLFEAMPSQVETAQATSPEPVGWSRAFDAAGLDRSAFADATPERTPRTFADERRAWTGMLPGTNIPIRVEAAGYRGKPVYFELVAPWTRPTREPNVLEDASSSTLSVLLILSLLIVSVFLTRRNLKSGRADRRGAFRLAVFAFALSMVTWVLAPHVRDLVIERDRLYVALGIALFLGGALLVVYLALEPFVRSSWPKTLIGWSRLLSGRLRDPIIGRDVLIGVAGGVALALFDVGQIWLPRVLGWAEPPPVQPLLTALLNGRMFVIMLQGCVNYALQNALILTLLFAMLRHAARALMGRLGWHRLPVDSVVAIVALVVLSVITAEQATGGAGPVWLPAVDEALTVGVMLFVLLDAGLLALGVAYGVQALFARAPIVLDPSRFFALDGWITLALIAGLAIWGYVMARGSVEWSPTTSRARITA